MRTQPTHPATSAKLPEFDGAQDRRPMMTELYRNAEAQVRKLQLKKKRQKTKAAGVVKTEGDAQRLLHELQVHQVELEMQNDELQEARDRMEVLLEKYTDLYDFAPVGYLSLDESGGILEANLTGAALLGVERARLLNRRLPLLVSPTSRPDFLAFLNRVFAGTGKQVCEALLIREDRTSFWGELNGSAALSLDGARKWCRVSISDITVLKAAEEVQGRMAAIVQSSDDAIIGKDLNGIITSWNPGAERIFGFTAVEMMGTSIQRLIPADRYGEGKRLLGNIKADKSVQHFETRRQTKDGRLIDVSITASPIKNADGKVIGVSKVARDISERKLAEIILRRNEALFSALIEQSPVGVYVIDAQFRLQQVNPRARPVFNKARPLIGRDLSEILHILWPKRVADQVAKHFRHTLKTGEPYQASEFAERRRDTGADEIYEWQLQRVTLPAGEYGVVCFFNNITERKRAEIAQRRVAVLAASNLKLEREIVRRQAIERSLQRSEDQLRKLSRQVLQAQEEERERISRELHDVIAQTLTSISIRLTVLKKEAAHKTAGFERSITRTQLLVEQSVDIVHKFARDLRPAILDDLGLIPALHAHLKSFVARTGIRTSLTAFAGVEQLDPARRTVLFRVAQEALTNIAKHSQASQAWVKIQKLKDAICMKIIDDGNGFPAGRVLQTKKRARLGLLGMRERLEMVNGNFTIDSSPGQGTTIRAQIPFRGSLARSRKNGAVIRKRQDLTQTKRKR